MTAPVAVTLAIFSKHAHLLKVGMHLIVKGIQESGNKRYMQVILEEHNVGGAPKK